MLVADKGDLTYFRQFAFTYFKNKIDAILRKLNNLRHDRRRETTASPINIHNPLKIRLNPGPREDDTGAQFYFIAKDIIGNPFVSLKGDTVDNRILDHPHHNILPIPADIHVRKQACSEQCLQSFIKRRRRNRITRAHAHIGPDSIRFDALGTFNPDIAQAVINRLRVHSLSINRNKKRDCDEYRKEAVRHPPQSSQPFIHHGVILHVTRFTKKSTTCSCTRSFQVANTIKASTIVIPILNPYSCARSPSGFPLRASIA